MKQEDILGEGFYWNTGKFQFNVFWEENFWLSAGQKSFFSSSSLSPVLGEITQPKEHCKQREEVAVVTDMLGAESVRQW